MNTDDEVLYGWDAIGRVVSMTARQTEYRLEAGRGPIFKVGRKIAARRGALRKWLSDLERAGTSDAAKA